MMLFRSFTIGLLGACLYLLAQVAERVDTSVMSPIVIQRPLELSRIDVPRLPSMMAHVPAPSVSVVDVGRGVPVATVLSLLQIPADERIASVDDVPVDNDPYAGVLIAEHITDHNRGRYLDLTIAARAEPMRTRRLLVLLH